VNCLNRLNADCSNCDSRRGLALGVDLVAERLDSPMLDSCAILPALLADIAEVDIAEVDIAAEDKSEDMVEEELQDAIHREPVAKRAAELAVGSQEVAWFHTAEQIQVVDTDQSVQDAQDADCTLNEISLRQTDESVEVLDGKIHDHFCTHFCLNNIPMNRHDLFL